jgi:hypothetical protein
LGDGPQLYGGRHLRLGRSSYRTVSISWGEKEERKVRSRIMLGNEGIKQRKDMSSKKKVKEALGLKPEI